MAFTKELISYDPLTRLSTFHSYEYETGTSVFEYVGDATPSLDVNKARQNCPEIWKAGMKESFVLYASFDPIVQMKLLCEHGIDIYKKEHGPRLSKLLEHPDWRYLKCTNKTHIISAHD